MRAVLILMFVCASNVFAGEEEAFACRHCGLKGTYISGNLMTAEQRVAFCGNKDHFVSISWDYYKRPPKPVRLDGKTPVFACPICKLGSKYAILAEGYFAKLAFTPSA